MKMIEKLLDNAMKSVLYLAVWLMVLQPWDCLTDDVIDPCSDGTYRLLPRASYRGGVCLYNSSRPTCDAALVTSWYRAIGNNGENLKMQETEADLFACGTKFPIWMDGKHPSMTEGIVNRTLLQAFSAWTTSVQVKSCKDEFFVYRLSPTRACPEAYCFGETDSDPCPSFDPCDIYEHQNIVYSPEQSSYCSQKNDEVCSLNNEIRWVVYEGNEQSEFLNVSTRPVRSGSCGSSSPVWIKDSGSPDQYGMKTLQLCVGSETNDCERTMITRAKDCQWFTVYEIPESVGCGDFCLEDESAPCAIKQNALTTVTSTETMPMGSQQTVSDISSMTPDNSTLNQEHASKTQEISTSGTVTRDKTLESVTVTSGENQQSSTKWETNSPPAILYAKNDVIIVAVVVAGAVILAMIVLVIFVLRRRSFKQDKLQYPDPAEHMYRNIVLKLYGKGDQVIDTADHVYHCIPERLSSEPEKVQMPDLNDDGYLHAQETKRNEEQYADIKDV